jgi:hypothetical protein
VTHAEREYDVVGELWGCVLFTPKGRVPPSLTYTGCTERGGVASVTFDLTLPALVAGAVTRLALFVLADGRLLADTASRAPGMALDLVRPARLDRLDPATARQVTLRAPVQLPAAGLIVVRFYDARGRWRDAVPVIGPCAAPPGAASE